MKTRNILLSFCLCICAIFPASAQNRDDHLTIDSLTRLLATAKEDSARLRLKYSIGAKQDIARAGYWDSLVTDARRLNLPNYECNALISVGLSWQAQGDINTAINYFNRALTIAERHGYKQSVMAVCVNLSQAYAAIPDIGRALGVSYQGLRTADELDDKPFIYLFNAAIASYYYSLGEINKALKVHFKCLEICKELQNSTNIAGTLLDIGSDYRELRDDSAAIRYYLESRKYIHYIPNITYVGQIYSSVGAAFDMMHRPDSACWYYSKSYNISQSLGYKEGMASNLSLMARSNVRMGRNAVAKKQALEAMELVKVTKFTKQIPSIAVTLKEIYENEHDYKGALEAYELYIAIKDSLSNDKMRDQASQKEFGYALQKKESERQLLAQKNEIQSLQLKQNSYLVLGLCATLLLTLVISYLLIRQGKLSAQQQSMQLEQKLLRSQMNPHFIFNSLQAIQNFILRHDSKEAVKYLSSFANVARTVLDSSRTDYISLKKEIALLENYLQLQKLRFGSRFDYSITVDDQIEQEFISVPPMLAQPFIENAVNHGMHDIQEGGIINVRYYLGNNTLVMEITDNGYGINQATFKNKEHQSLAMEITKERVMLINKRAKRKATYAVTEAYPHSNERSGVKVNFVLPINLS